MTLTAKILAVGILLGTGFIGRQAFAQNDPLIPSASPFGYNVGIDYETDQDGRTGYSVTADLNQITQYFQLVRTYHDTADPNATTPTIDPNELQVIQYAMTHPNFRLVLGTYNSALVTGTTGSFGPGLMNSSTYTDAWAQMLISAFGGSTTAVTRSVKTILIGNEPDFPGTFIPAPADPNYSTYVGTWIPNALTNLQASLNKAGLGSIPISVVIAFSPISAPAGDTVSTAIPQFISSHWNTAWNGSQPFVLYNQYSNSTPPNFADISGYLQGVVASPNVTNEVFPGETGVQSPGGDSTQEAAFYQQMFAFLTGELQQSGATLPAFVFQAFDLPSLNQTYGLFSQNANSQPTGLKAGISIPTWVGQPAPTSSSLLAAVLPESRSVQIGVPATAFATIINNSNPPSTATNCAIAPNTTVPASFVYSDDKPRDQRVDRHAEYASQHPAGGIPELCHRADSERRVHPDQFGVQLWLH